MPISRPLGVISMADIDVALMAHLMSRAGFGATREELDARVASGYEQTVEELLDPERQEPVDRLEYLRYHSWAWKPGTMSNPGASSWLYQMIKTDRPLEEKMTLFWHQVFATGVDVQRLCPPNPKSTEGMTMQQRNGR